MIKLSKCKGPLPRLAKETHGVPTPPVLLYFKKEKKANKKKIKTSSVDFSIDSKNLTRKVRDIRIVLFYYFLSQLLTMSLR